MSRAAATVVFLLEFLGSCVLLFPALIGLSFLHEVLRNRPMPLFAQLLRLAAILTAFVPMISVAVCAGKTLRADGARPVPSAAVWTPVIAAVASGILFFGLIMGAELVATRVK